MGTWVEQVHGRARVLIDQLVAWRSAQESAKVDISHAIAELSKKIESLYEVELPLAHIIDKSDLVIHAEGPAASTTAPDLRAFNWLCGSAEKQIRVLARSVFDLSDLDAKRMSKKLDLRFSGFAPGSIYAGFSISEISPILGSTEPEMVYDTLRNAVRQLPTIPQFIDDEAIDAEISEAMPDPAMRDASLEAVFRLSPTGRGGIHTIEISSPEAGHNALTYRDRAVLKEALLHPISRQRHFGRFVGDVRVIDMDSGRFQLRNIPSIGGLRCVLPNATNELWKKILGSQVCVEGEYETDRSGRPRLLFVHHIWPSDPPAQITF